MQTVDLTHHFLIAMPGMVDPNFARTLTYICEHNEQGALGVVVNRPIDMTLGDLFDRVGLTLQDPALAADPVYFGGPVQVDRGFVLHRPLGEWGSTLVVRDGVGFTTSKDILEAVAAGGGPGNLLVSLGYAGWAPGQIEEELLQNAWLTVAAEASVIFDLPSEDRFDAAMRILGVNPASLSEAAGHA
jgi:putative transcriptional regulator